MERPDKIIVVGHGHPRISDALQSVIESQKISGSDCIVIENVETEPIVLPIFEIKIEKMETNFEKIEPKTDWKKSGKPKKWKLK